MGHSKRGDDLFQKTTKDGKPARPLGGWSKRTRKMYEFISKKRERKLSYNGLTEGKQKLTAVGVFYELLVLKSRALLRVTQATAYGDITIEKTKEFKKGRSYKLSDHIDDE